jgi:hypothetical protein
MVSDNLDPFMRVFFIFLFFLYLIIIGSLVEELRTFVIILSVIEVLLVFLGFYSLVVYKAHVSEISKTEAACYYLKFKFLASAVDIITYDEKEHKEKVQEKLEEIEE